MILSVAFPEPRFAKPTGRYSVGTRIYHWVDAARPEAFTPDRNDRRELIAQVWYPADANTDATAPYIGSRETLAAIATQFHIPAFLLGNLNSAPTHATTDAKAAHGRFPLLINPTGFLGFRNASLFWIEELVSHGYVVIGLDQPGTAAATTFPDGRVVRAMHPKAAFDRYMPLALARSPTQAPVLNGITLPGGVIPFLAEDIRFALRQADRLNREDKVLAGRIDTGRAGVYGLSLGGYSGAEACRIEPRLRACLVADSGQTAAVARNGLDQPVLIMSRDPRVMREERAAAGGWPEDEIAHTVGDERALYERSRGDAYYLTLNGMYHVNWTDAPVWSPLIRWMGLAGPIDPYRGFAATNAYSVAFFDRYLKGRASPLLEGPSDKWREVRIERRSGSRNGPPM
ncbi:MAG: hypothetical protein LH485_08895 [Sphingomonas bacterium]|nr:hypothetical protein [Sphingomonas bacterium]